MQAPGTVRLLTTMLPAVPQDSSNLPSSDIDSSDSSDRPSDSPSMKSGLLLFLLPVILSRDASRSFIPSCPCHQYWCTAYSALSLPKS